MFFFPIARFVNLWWKTPWLSMIVQISGAISSEHWKGVLVKMMGLRRSIQLLVTLSKNRENSGPRDIQVKPFQFSMKRLGYPHVNDLESGTPHFRTISHPSLGMEATGYSRDTGGVERDRWIDVATRNLLTHQKKTSEKLFFWFISNGFEDPEPGVGLNFCWGVFFFSHFKRLPASPMMPTWIFSDFLPILVFGSPWLIFTIPLRNLGRFFLNLQVAGLDGSGYAESAESGGPSLSNPICRCFFCSILEMLFSFAWRSHQTRNNQTSLRLETMSGLIFSYWNKLVGS